MKRRDFIQTAALAGAAIGLPASRAASARPPAGSFAAETGDQRLSLDRLRAWEELGFGMFIHFGMSTFDGEELSMGDKPSALYAPEHPDAGQWMSVAAEAGMRYAVLTTKHVSGHCLWPSRHTDYHVGTSSNKTDVVEAFVTACRKEGILPGFYYCSWDNHHRMGSGTPSFVAWKDAYTSSEYQEFQWKQLEELLTQYGPIAEVWIDIPGVLPRDYRNKLYHQIAQWQPDALIMMNHGIGDGSEFNVNYAWPSDLMAIERFLPNSHSGHVKWRDIEGKRYYIPGEVCDPIGKEWFYVEGDVPRSDAELLGMYLVCRSRGTNLLLNVPPDRNGRIPDMYRQSLVRLRKNIDRLGMADQ